MTDFFFFGVSLEDKIVYRVSEVLPPARLTLLKI
jgi:hypothetical protein